MKPNRETAALLDRVHAAGGLLMARGDALQVRAQRPLPDALMAAIRERKAALLDCVRDCSRCERHRRRGVLILLCGCGAGRRAWSESLTELASRRLGELKQG